MLLLRESTMHCADTRQLEGNTKRHGSRTFDQLMQALAGRPGKAADHRMILLCSLLEQGVEDALGSRLRLPAPQRVLLRSIEKT